MRAAMILCLCLTGCVGSIETTSAPEEEPCEQVTDTPVTIACRGAVVSVCRCGYARVDCTTADVPDLLCCPEGC